MVGDRFLRSQCTASKKAAFQNRRLCLQGQREMLEMATSHLPPSVPESPQGQEVVQGGSKQDQVQVLD